MSGTTAHVRRVELKLKAERDKAIALSENKTTLLQMTIAELINLYGKDNVNANHPLFSAIRQGANGNMINIETLSNDIAEFDTEAVDV